MRDAIQQQQDLISIVLAVAGILVVIVLTSGAVSQFILHRKAVADAVADATKHITEDTRQMISDEVKVMKAAQETRFLRLEANTTGTLVATCISADEFRLAAKLAVTAAVAFHMAESDGPCRQMLDAAISCLSQCTYLEDEPKQSIQAYLTVIPDILKVERDKIAKRLEELPSSPLDKPAPKESQ